MTRALCLAGGAARGAVQVPVIQHLMKNNRYDAIYGVSVGSLNGAIAAQGHADSLSEIWSGIDGLRDFMNFEPRMRKAGIFDTEPLQRIVERKIRLDQIKTEFLAGIVSLSSGEYFNYSTRDMKRNKHLWGAVLASSAMPLIMHTRPVMVPRKNGKGYREILCVDGGTRNSLPQLDRSYDEIHVVLCSPFDRAKQVPKGWEPEGLFKTATSVISRVFEIMRDDTLDSDLELLRAHSELPLKIWAPSDYTSTLLDAKQETIQARIRMGHRMVREGPVQL